MDQSTTLGATSAVGVAACWPRAPPTSTAASCTAAGATPSRPDRPAPPSPPPTPLGSPPNRCATWIWQIKSVTQQSVCCIFWTDVSLDVSSKQTFEISLPGPRLPEVRRQGVRGREGGGEGRGVPQTLLQVSCDWWTRGHVTPCSHLIGPQLPLLRPVPQPRQLLLP